MEIWTNIVALWNQYLINIHLTDVLDIAIIAYLVYRLLGLVRSTNSERILKGVLIVLLALGLSTFFELRSLEFVLSMLMEWGVLALIILFQPEIRRILEQVGGSRFSFMRVLGKGQQTSAIERAIDVTASACADMSKSRTGALIVFERKILLDEYFKTGTLLDAIVSDELLRNLFFTKAALHAGCVLRHIG